MISTLPVESMAPSSPLGECEPFVERAEQHDREQRAQLLNKPAELCRAQEGGGKGGDQIRGPTSGEDAPICEVITIPANPATVARTRASRNAAGWS